MRAVRHLTPAALSACAALFAFGSGQASAETRSFPLSNFHAVDAHAGVRVILKQGPFAVSVEEPQGRFDQLQIEVKDSALSIGRKSNRDLRPDQQPNYTITVTAPAYDAIAVRSGASLTGDALSAKSLAASVSSGASATLKGSCSELTLQTSSGANFEGEDFRCETATISASSGSSAETFASRTVTAAAASGASVIFHGQPATVTKAASSGGSIKAR